METRAPLWPAERPGREMFLWSVSEGLTDFNQGSLEPVLFFVVFEGKFLQQQTSCNP